MNPTRIHFVAAALAAGLLANSTHSALPVADIKRAKPVDFQNEILPMLRANCLACHNHTKSKADVILETPQDIAKSDIVVPGKPMESLLFQSAAHMEDPAMPPKENKVSAKSLSANQLGLLKLWITQGAKGEVRGARIVEWQPLPTGLNPIYSATVSPNGQYAAAGRANQIFLYHISSKSLITRLTDPALLKIGNYKEGVSHRDLVHSMAFHPSGELLASGGFREVKLWRRQPIVPAKTFAANPTVLALSADSQTLAQAEGNSIRLLNAATGQSVKTLIGHKAPVTAIAFSLDNTLLLTGAQDGAIHIWTIADGKFTVPKLALEKPTPITSAAWTADGKLIATAHGDNVIRAWNLATARTINATLAKALAASKLATLAQQKLFGTADASAKTAVTQVANAKANAPKAAAALAVALKASAAATKAVPPAKATTAKALATFNTAEAAAKTAEANAKKIGADANQKPEAKQAAAKTATDNRKVADTAKVAHTKAQTAEAALVKTAAEKAKAVTLAKAADTKAKADLTASTKAVADTQKAVTTAKAALDKAKTAEDAAAKAGLKPHKEMKGHSQPVLALIQLPKSPTQILSGSRDGTLRHWDANTAQAIRSMSHGGPVLAVAVSADGVKFASASEKGTGKLWTASNGLQIAELKGTRKSIENSAGKDRFAAFAKVEVGYYTAYLKTQTDNHKKGEDRVKKADESLKKAVGMPIAEKKKILDTAQAEQTKTEISYTKLKADYDNEVKIFPPLDAAAKTAEAVAAKAKTAAAQPVADLAAKEKIAVTRKTAATAAQKKIDQQIASQQKPAEAKLATAKKTVTAANTAKVNTEKVLVTAKAVTAAMKKAFEAADQAAKAAELNSTKTAGDATKKPEEKQAAAQAATGKRKAANTAKTALTQAQAKEKTAQTATTTATTKFTQGSAALKTTESVLTTAKVAVANAQKAHTGAAKLAEDAAKAAVAAKPIAEKAKASQAATMKVATDKRKVATDSKTKRDQLNKDQTAAKKKKDDGAKKVTAADTEYKKLEEPRQQDANEAKLSKEALTKITAEKKTAEGQKIVADQQQKTADVTAKTAKDALAQAGQPVRTIAFSADGLTVVTGGEDQKLHLWNAATGKENDSFICHKGVIRFVAFTASGQILSVGADKKAALCDPVAQWKLERTVGTGDGKSPIIDRVTALAFSRDGTQLAAGSGEPSRSGTVQVFAVASGTLTRNFQEVHSDTVMGLQFNAAGTQIASGSADKFAKVTNLADGKILHAFEGHSHHVLGVAWQYNGRILASVGADKEIKVWNVITGERAGKGTGYGKEVTSIHFVGYTDQAVLSAGDNRVRRVRVPMGNPSNVRDFSGSKDFVYSSAVSADGAVIIAGGEASVLRVWNGINGQVIAAFEPPKVEESR